MIVSGIEQYKSSFIIHRSSMDNVQRVWRLRKRHHTVDAEFHAAPAGGIDLRFFYNGTLSYSKHCATRADAVAEAAAKRAELEREGWIFHW